MTSSTSSWGERPFAAVIPDNLQGPLLVVEAARRDALWAWLDPGARRLVSGRITARGAAEHLAPAIDAGARALGQRPRELAAVAVGVGPGSYTGIRIAMAYAKGLALALGRPLIGLPTLGCMLSDVPRAPGQTLSLVNAFAGQVYAYGEDDNGQAWLPLDAYTPERLLAAITGPVRVLVDGGLPPVKGFSLPAAATLVDVSAAMPLQGGVEWALRAYGEGRFDDPMTLVPAYGRASSAELQLHR